MRSPHVKIADMTLAEKIGQLTMLSPPLDQAGAHLAEAAHDRIRTGEIGSVLNLTGVERIEEAQRIAVEQSRLGIPLLFGLDVVHGYRTVFPIPLGEASSFDPGLWRRTAAAAALEAAAAGIDLTFAPMLDIGRDPRWGRIAEGPGEDAWLGAAFARAKVRGFQGGNAADKRRMAATAKHFVAYGAATSGRDYNPVDISERQLHEVYLPPFKAAVEAGALAIMPAFVDIAGVPMSAHRPLLTGLARETWGFDGVYISDYHALAELIAHGVAGDLAHAAALALNAGLDIDMMSDTFPRGLPEALDRGLVTMATIDAAVRRVLSLKQRLGLFDDPYLRCRPATRRPKDVTAAHRALARDAGRRSIVLLTRRGTLLPLSESGGPIALVGPLGHAPAEVMGPWSGLGQPSEAIDVASGLAAALPSRAIHTVAGCAIETADAAGLADALAIASEADCIVLALGEASGMSGEASSRADPSLPAPQIALARAMLDLGKPVAVLVFSGRPLILPPWLIERADAVLAVWFPGSEAGHAIADVLTGRWNPSARLPVSWPDSVGQIPVFYGQRPGGRPASEDDHFTSRYLDAPVAPRFVFGHGLSYSTFTHGRPVVEPATLRRGGKVEIQVEVANTGPSAGEETVLMFIRDPVASVSRPLLDLRGAAKIMLEPGAKGTVAFTLTAADCLLLDAALKPRLEAGAIELWIGPAADRARLQQATITIETPAPARRRAPKPKGRP